MFLEDVFRDKWGQILFFRALLLCVQGKPCLRPFATNNGQWKTLWILFLKITTVAAFKGLCSQSKPHWRLNMHRKII